ncbi:hypothetical protein FHS27_001632 [Rhodopirellula rubra]|uniref:Uncharacterized protein n=1 Tax=Aporhodopirellula rubra TaxID=980271 RepID=A0A7W5DXF2_9BACT|nr:hypothetical protein [Aporhodopirellula rubra]
MSAATDGGSHDVELATYRAATDPSQLQTQIIRAIVSLVSSRSIEDIKPNSPGVSRSNVSRLWKEVGHKFVCELRGKDWGAQSW